MIAVAGGRAAASRVDPSLQIDAEFINRESGYVNDNNNTFLCSAFINYILLGLSERNGLANEPLKT